MKTTNFEAVVSKMGVPPELQELVSKVRQSIDVRQCSQALSLLNSSQHNHILIVLLKVKLLCSLKRVDAARLLIDQELQKIPYTDPIAYYLFSFLTEYGISPGSSSPLPTDKELIIFDRIFPSLKCSFTTVEFNAYLEHFSNASVYTTATDMYNLEKKSFEDVRSSFGEKYPKFANRVRKVDTKINFEGKFIYTLFLRNIFQMLEFVEKSKSPFIFTLYSGGDYCLDQEVSDAMIRRVTQSSCFKKVIVVERVTRDYLISKNFVKEQDIEFIFGPITNRDYLVQNQQPKRFYKQHKDTFDICFVAYKHSPQGRDKGYDVFIQVAHNLIKKYNNVRFHVVGGHTPQDVDVTRLKDKIQFYGGQAMDFFPKFHAGMDIIVSPSLPFTLYPGSFDGAPNVSTAEAGLCGVAVFTTDQLKQNTRHENGKHLVFVPHDAWEITNVIEHYYKDYDSLYQLANQGRAEFEKTYGYEAQIKPRIRLLEKHLSQES